VYRFLLTRQWLGLAALMLALAVVMVGLGNWQLSRFQQKSAINDRIDAAAAAEPVPVGSVLSSRVPARAERYTRVTATGRYDPANEILATHNGNEMDLVLTKGLQPIITADIKYSISPEITKGNLLAAADLKTENNYLIVPKEENYPLNRNFTVIGLRKFLEVMKKA
jgi:hypothetical protein